MDEKKDVVGVTSSTPNQPTNDNMKYDFDFQNQVNTPLQSNSKIATSMPINATPDPAIGQVNPNPVVVENVVPVDIDTAAGTEAKKEEVAKEVQQQTQSNIKTSGTATEAEIVIDATKEAPEVLDEYAISMDAVAEKKRIKKNNIFIGVVFGVIIIFIILLRVIINIVGY